MRKTSRITKEFADFLKHEYGIGGHSANEPIAFVDHDSKGIQFTLNDENGRMSDTKFTFTWTEAAKMASDLIDKGEYLSEKQAEQYIEWKNPVKEDVAVDEAVEEIVADSHEEIIEPETVKADEPVPTEKADNFVITDDSLGEGGAKTKFKNNISAIETLKTLESEKRPATAEEKETLSRYVGWVRFRRLSISRRISGRLNTRSFGTSHSRGIPSGTFYRWRCFLYQPDNY